MEENVILQIFLLYFCTFFVMKISQNLLQFFQHFGKAKLINLRSNFLFMKCCFKTQSEESYKMTVGEYSKIENFNSLVFAVQFIRNILFLLETTTIL